MRRRRFITRRRHRRFITSRRMSFNNRFITDRLVITARHAAITARLRVITAVAAQVAGDGGRLSTTAASIA
jgi:hypothetical protein